MHLCTKYVSTYSRLSNNRRVWNKRIGWTFASRKINVWYGIIVLGGKIPKINNRIGWKILGDFFPQYYTLLEVVFSMDKL